MKTTRSAQPSTADRSVELERPLTVSVETVCRLTSLAATTIWHYIKTGRLKTVKLGHRTLVLFDSVERLLGTGE